MSDVFTRDDIRHNWGWFLALGAVLILFGCIAIVSSAVMTLAFVILVGFLLLISGVMLIIHAFMHGHEGSFVLPLLGGIVDIILGFMFIMHPGASALGLTLMLAAFFMVVGVFRLATALSWHVPHRGWELLSGGVTLLLGILLWRQWPVSGLWFIGFCVGLDFLFRGWSFVMLSLALRGPGHRPLFARRGI